MIGFLQTVKLFSQEEAVKVLCSQVKFISSGSTVGLADCQQQCKVILDAVHMKLNLKDI